MFRRTSGGMARRSRRDDPIQVTGLTFFIISIYKFRYGPSTSNAVPPVKRPVASRAKMPVQFPVGFVPRLESAGDRSQWRWQDVSVTIATQVGATARDPRGSGLVIRDDGCFECTGTPASRSFNRRREFGRQWLLQ